jgi:methionine-S-sulfoxide reductase
VGPPRRRRWKGPGAVRRVLIVHADAGVTGHAEAVEVWFDPTVVGYDDLLNTFWSTHDPTALYGQRSGFGSQYRSAIFFHDPGQERLTITSRDEQHRTLARPITTVIVPASAFYAAEDYYQRYFETHDGAISRRCFPWAPCRRTPRKAWRPAYALGVSVRRARGSGT